MNTIAKLRQELAIVMQEYCRHTQNNPNIVLGKLYEKYHVSSRSELTEDELKECIASYRAGIKYEEPNHIEIEFDRMLDKYKQREKK